jgi:predicted RNA-binding protein with TRAM domain
MSIERSPEHEQAHRAAKQRDARKQYEVGEKLTVVLEQDPEMNNGRDGIARINGLVVFVYPAEIPVDPGAHLEVVVSDIHPNHLRAVAVRRLK